MKKDDELTEEKYQMLMAKIAKSLILANLTKPKECPVCGSSEIRTNSACLSEEWEVECIKCFAHTYFFPKREDAIIAWNQQNIYLYPDNRPYKKGEKQCLR